MFDQSDVSTIRQKDNLCVKAVFHSCNALKADLSTQQVMVTLVRAQDDGVQVKLKPVDQVSVMTSTKLSQSFLDKCGLKL